jgi:simple sugar transport system substrate-binding protein
MVLMVGVMLLFGTGAAQAAEALKIGFVYVSPIGDRLDDLTGPQGRGHSGRWWSPNTWRTCRRWMPSALSQAGRIRRKLVLTTSFGYMNPTIKVAPQFPNVAFMHATGYKSAKNVGIYNARFYEGRYLTGVVAGKMSKKNVAGYVAAFPIPEVLQGINAFVRGMRSVNPKAELKVIWVNSWFDPGKEREAALTLISQGADVVTHHTDSTAVVQAAEEKGVWAVGYHSDMSKYGPKAHLTAATHIWGDIYTKAAQDVLAGKWKPMNVWGGIKDKMVKLAPINAAVPAEVKEQVVKLEKDIVAGKFHAFAGPLKDNEGKERVPAGKTMTDDAMQKMDFYVVRRKLPTGTARGRRDGPLSPSTNLGRNAAHSHRLCCRF